MNKAVEDVPDSAIDLIITELRANRARVEAAEQAGTSTKVRGPRRSPKLEIRGSINDVVLDPDRKFEL